jgi:chaperone BCS1
MLTKIFCAIFATIEGDIPPRQTSTGGLKLSAEAEAEMEEKAKKEAEAKKIADDARVSELAKQFAALIPPLTFSPAEIQGYLLKNKREPEAAVKNATEWVKTTLVAKKQKAKEDEDEKEKEEKERKKKEEEERENAEREARAKFWSFPI